MRAKLGLKPLAVQHEEPANHDNASLAPQDDAKSREAERRAQQLSLEIKRRQQARQEKKRQQAESNTLMSELEFKTKGSAQAWIERSRRLAAQQQADQAKQAQSASVEQTKQQTQEYNSSSLAGLRLQHSIDDFSAGQDTILTLADTDILKERQLNDDEDVLTSVALSEAQRQTKLAKERLRVKQQLLRREQYDMTNEEPILAKYGDAHDGTQNDAATQNGIRLSAAGDYDFQESTARRLQAERDAAQAQGRQIVELTSNTGKSIAANSVLSDFAESKVRFKKRKRDTNSAKSEAKSHKSVVHETNEQLSIVDQILAAQNSNHDTAAGVFAQGKRSVPTTAATASAPASATITASSRDAAYDRALARAEMQTRTRVQRDQQAELRQKEQQQQAQQARSAASNSTQAHPTIISPSRGQPVASMTHATAHMSIHTAPSSPQPVESHATIENGASRNADQQHVVVNLSSDSEDDAAELQRSLERARLRNLRIQQQKQQQQQDWEKTASGNQVSSESESRHLAIDPHHREQQSIRELAQRIKSESNLNAADAYADIKIKTEEGADGDSAMQLADSHAQDSTNAMTNNDAIVLTSTSEFVRSIGNEKAQSHSAAPLAPDSKQNQSRPFSQSIEQEPTSGQPHSHASSPADAQMKDEDDSKQQEDDDEDELHSNSSSGVEYDEDGGVIESEPLAASSISSALELARRRAYIQPNKSAKQKQGATQSSSGADNVIEIGSRFNLDRYDAYGRKLNEKEAFRALSHVFHGHKAGLVKTEKRLRRVAKEQQQQYHQQQLVTHQLVKAVPKKASASTTGGHASNLASSHHQIKKQKT